MIYFVPEQVVRHAAAATLGVRRQIAGFALHCGMIIILAIVGVTSLNYDNNSDFHTRRVSGTPRPICAATAVLRSDSLC